jgi:hypothetical protein
MERISAETLTHTFESRDLDTNRISKLNSILIQKNFHLPYNTFSTLMKLVCAKKSLNKFFSIYKNLFLILSGFQFDIIVEGTSIRLSI